MSTQGLEVWKVLYDIVRGNILFRAKDSVQLLAQLLQLVRIHVEEDESID